MKIVIDIPDEDYNVIIANADFYKEQHWGVAEVWDAIVDGTPLPKEHGELIDKDVVLDMMNHGILEEYITTMGGVIPADK
jgi:hypothetical protein